MREAGGSCPNGTGRAHRQQIITKSVTIRGHSPRMLTDLVKAGRPNPFGPLSLTVYPSAPPCQLDRPPAPRRWPAVWAAVNLAGAARSSRRRLTAVDPRPYPGRKIAHGH